jgi:hypothetical protein
MSDTSSLAERLLRFGKLPNLTEIVGARDVNDEKVLGFVWGVFSFRGLSTAVRREQEGKPYAHATFSGKIPMGGDEYKLSGIMFNDHVYSVSSPVVLTGRRRMLIAGQFEFKGKDVKVFPYIIGEVTSDLGGFLPMSWSSSIRVYPSGIDSFEKVRELPAPGKAHLEAVLRMSEDDVKRAFAEIIGEPFVPKDWGGERSDLITSRLVIDKQPTSAAFIFKGPSVSGTMHPSNMGKRGDQLIRAFDEPVDMVVVQHCSAIANSVVRTAEALAYDLRRPRRYCIIDGADTAQILRAYDKLKGEPR